MIKNWTVKVKQIRNSGYRKKYKKVINKDGSVKYKATRAKGRKVINGFINHVNYLKDKAKLHYACAIPSEGEHFFFAPHLYEISDLTVLEREVFGPVVHIIRFKAEEVDQVIRVLGEAGQEATGFQCSAQFRLVICQSLGDAVAQRTGLAGSHQEAEVGHRLLARLGLGLVAQEVGAHAQRLDDVVGTRARIGHLEAKRARHRRARDRLGDACGAETHGNLRKVG